MNRNNNTKDNTLAVFKNSDWHEGSDRPIYKGTGNWQCPSCKKGAEFKVSLWLREASGDGKLEAGTKFLSGTFDQWQPKPQAQRPQRSEAPVASDDIPF